MPEKKNPAEGRTGRKRGNPENLIKNSELTPEERRERASKAGRASVKARRAQKTFKEALLAILELQTPERPEMSFREAIAIAMIEKAATGDKGAAEFVRDTIGEKPTEHTHADLTNSDGSLSPKTAGLDISAWTPEQVAIACGAVFDDGAQ